ncbi:MAG: AmpG family muropeptide MFS transporter [Magnetococcales bacterium]|nr:AmpG family muropeptide MFS transporter [Magnetococcales bacterium]
MAHWLRVYGERRVLIILFLGFSSGLPLALTFGTLSVWMAEAGVSKSTIGLFALAGAPYTFKFLWSPLVDRMPIPPLTRLFGQRRGWMLATQGALILSIIGLGNSHPGVDPVVTALFALATTFWSASQDIAIDAYRVEILDESQYGAGAAMVVLGYRIGMLVSGAGALFLADSAGWFQTYLIMGLLMLVGVVTVLLSPEPERRPSKRSKKQEARISAFLEKHPEYPQALSKSLAWIHGAVVEPFAEFMTRTGWIWVLLFILLYKFGDALAGVMSGPFYVELGFSKTEIASISKAFGLTATIIGSVIGGIVVSRLGIFRALVICGVLQMLSNLMFVVLAKAGADTGVLTVTIALENLSGGMGTAAFVAYLSSLCDVAYTATQYALLSSFMAFGRTLLSSGGGVLADSTDWATFFLLTTVAAIPGLLMLYAMRRFFPEQTTSIVHNEQRE